MDEVTGAIKINFPELEPEDMEHSCSLDAAEDGKRDCREVGELINLSREGVRKLTIQAQQKIRARANLDCPFCGGPLFKEALFEGASKLTALVCKSCGQKT